MNDRLSDDVINAGKRYMQHLFTCYRMKHPKNSPYTFIEVSTGAAGMVNEAWDKDAHLLAREFLGINEPARHPSPAEKIGFPSDFKLEDWQA